MASYASVPAVERLIKLALEEDLGRGDATTEAIFKGDGTAIVASLVAREALVVFGIELVRAVFAAVDSTTRVQGLLDEGACAAAGDIVAQVHGSVRAVLMAERTALNFIQRLSGVATSARAYASAVAGTGARVVDTRKTTPGYRVLEKAAVRAGGCYNHRFDLGSGILIKDNHIAACGSIVAAVERARQVAPHSLRIEVEVSELAQLEPALAAGAEVVLLDNMSVEQVRACAECVHARGALVEVSGGITLDTVRGYAEAGVDLISVGALTHSAPAVDLALDVVES